MDVNIDRFIQRIPIPDDNERFLIELEFVQSLSNPKYLHYLASKGYLEQESFLKFLRYLTYWKDPRYIKYISFPQCLRFLDEIISNPIFRRELKVSQFADYVHKEQGLHWMLQEEFLTDTNNNTNTDSTEEK